MYPSRMDQVLRVLVQAHLVRLPAAARGDESAVRQDVLATLATNIAAYGYALSKDAFAALRAASDGAARAWWEELEPVLSDLKGANRKVDEHVVYKNFPHEVLSMSESEYWLKQILMYWGFPNELFTEEPEARAPIDEAVRGRVLHPAKPESLERLLTDLLEQTTRWTDAQRESAAIVVKHFGARLDLARVKFKENMVRLALACLARGVPVTLASATDVLRLAFGMAEDGDPSLRTSTKLRPFKRRERRFLLGLLEGSTNLEDDMAERPERFKRLVHALHPGDWKDAYPRTIAAADRLYRDRLPATRASRIEAKLAVRDATVLDDLAERPGEFARALHRLVLTFGSKGSAAFEKTLPRLGVHRLLTLERYLAKVNERRFRTFPPRGDWSKLQIVAADPKRRLPNTELPRLGRAIAQELRARVGERVKSVRLSPDAKLVKLPTNDDQLLPYGRGTVFRLPKDVRFVRTASYWRAPSHGNAWFDNGWNFFDAKWRPAGACCWNAMRFPPEKDPIGAILSGDPTSSKDSEGRACQLIDLYLDALARADVRFAIWNVLGYSRLTFDDVPEVLAGLLWGKEPEKGPLFDAARVQLAFPLRGKSLTKYVAMLDLAKRELVFLDANLPARTQSACYNGEALSKTIPVYLEYLDSLPSVHDLFAHATPAADGMPVVYSDRDAPIRGGPAWVFEPRNEASRFEPFSLAALLAD